MQRIPRISPELSEPRHLAPVVEALERSRREPLRLCISTPPQHGKSSTVFHFIGDTLAREARPILYITYNEDFAVSQMYRARDVAVRAGVEFVPGNRALQEWRLVNGGGLYATGIGGSITGRPGGIVVVDDPIKGWVEAQSLRIRDITDNWFRTSVLTRLHPDSPVIVVATRWHEDDLIGRLVSRGWQWINLPAINDAGEALWPEGRPIEMLHEQRGPSGLGEVLFSAMFQGRPVPTGNAVFGAPSLCTLATIPSAGRRAMGVDLAYSAKTKADYSTRVDVLESLGDYYVTSVVRRQCRATEFVQDLLTGARLYPGAPMRWYAAGVEKGSADFMVAAGVPLDTRDATADKFVRASRRTAPLWNGGKLHVPADAPWSAAFVQELQAFTGAGDAHDDQVDGLVAAVDALEDTPNPTNVTTGRSLTTRGLRSAY